MEEAFAHHLLAFILILLSIHYILARMGSWVHIQLVDRKLVILGWSYRYRLVGILGDLMTFCFGIIKILLIEINKNYSK